MGLKVNQGSESAIRAVGAYRPHRAVPNSEIIEKIDSTDEWIQQRTGIQSRRFAGDDETVLSMSTAACQQALSRAGLQASDIDTIIVATISYEYQAPSAATALANALGAPKAAAFDISAACAGFCYGVGMARDLIRGGTSTHILVVGVEKLSDFTDPFDRATAFIFADGAGAVVISPSPEPGISATVWGSDSDNRDAIMLEPAWTDFKRSPEKGVTDLGWPNIAQQGQAVFRWAVYTVAKACQRILDAAGVKASELGAFIPHQANIRIIEAMCKEIDLPDSVVVADDIRNNGNTSAASIPLAMDALLTQHPDLHGELALLIGYGAGLVYAGQVVTLPPKPAQ